MNFFHRKSLQFFEFIEKFVHLSANLSIYKICYQIVENGVTVLPACQQFC